MATITQPAANTLASVEIVTGVSPGVKAIMLIKKIAIYYNWDANIAAPVPATIHNLMASLNTRQDLAVIPAFDDPGTIYYHNRAWQAGGDGATANEAPGYQSIQTGYPAYIEFDEPIPVADAVITFYMNTGGMNTARTAKIHIWYDIETVSLDEALQILESYR